MGLALWVLAEDAVARVFADDVGVVVARFGAIGDFHIAVQIIHQGDTDPAHPQENFHIFHWRQRPALEL